MSMKLKHSDVCTHIKNAEDHDILFRPLFDVNMRLFSTSPSYRKIVLGVCEYLRWCCATEKEGYKKPHGFSAANAGIPWNIIAVVNATAVQVMINPKITRRSAEKVHKKSNCGSLTLPEGVMVERRSSIDLEYYDEQGQKIDVFNITLANGGGTIQHEIDHNNGILILNMKELSERGLLQV